MSSEKKVCNTNKVNVRYMRHLKNSFISWLLQIKINLSKILSEREFVLGVIMILTNEKSRSAGAEDGNVVL